MLQQFHQRVNAFLQRRVHDAQRFLSLLDGAEGLAHAIHRVAGVVEAESLNCLLEERERRIGGGVSQLLQELRHTQEAAADEVEEHGGVADVDRRVVLVDRVGRVAGRVGVEGRETRERSLAHRPLGLLPRALLLLLSPHGAVGNEVHERRIEAFLPQHVSLLQLNLVEEIAESVHVGEGEVLEERVLLHALYESPPLQFVDSYRRSRWRLYICR